MLDCEHDVQPTEDRESEGGSPLPADDARRSGPADNHQHEQGGPELAKLTKGVEIPVSSGASRAEAEEYSDQYLPAVVQRASANFEKFYGLQPGEANAFLIDSVTSLKVTGWAQAEVLDWAAIDTEREAHESYLEDRRRRQRSSCVSFATSLDSADAEAAEEHNAQVARLISALGENGAGRRAVLTAVASRQGIEDGDDIEDLLHGRSDKKIHIPDGLRIAFQDIGLGHTLAPINLITSIEKEAVLMAENGKWEDIEFEVALDSGTVVHVCALVISSKSHPAAAVVRCSRWAMGERLKIWARNSCLYPTRSPIAIFARSFRLPQLLVH